MATEFIKRCPHCYSDDYSIKETVKYNHLSHEEQVCHCNVCNERFYLTEALELRKLPPQEPPPLSELGEV